MSRWKDVYSRSTKLFNKWTVRENLFYVKSKNSEEFVLKYILLRCYNFFL